jgi:hypothetical protein
MKSTVPKYLVRDYDATQEQWDRWLAFVEVAKVAIQTWETAYDWFHSLKKLGTGVSASMHSTSGHTTAWVGVKWAGASYRTSQYGSDSISLWMETSDCDLTDIAQISID